MNLTPTAGRSIPVVRITLRHLYMSSFILVDDAFWEAVDLQYWPTSDIEWYDPGQVTTQNGSLIINMVEVNSHGYRRYSQAYTLCRKQITA
jgi:Beta-glucan synthesis-associated protein SKN1/KRE6/Sbg1